MYMITGTVVNVFKQPEGKTREGTEYGGEYRVQIQGMNTLRNGEQRIQLETLRTKKGREYKDQIGTDVSVPVGCFVNNNRVIWFLVE